MSQTLNEQLVSFLQLVESDICEIFDALDSDVTRSAAQEMSFTAGELAERLKATTDFDGQGYLVRMLERIEKAMEFPNILNRDLADLSEQALAVIEAMRLRGGNDR